jgi:hypothetical protein
MPRQLRGPFEKLTSQASRGLESGRSQRSGTNSYGLEKISSEKETKMTLWLTTLCRGLLSGTSEDMEQMLSETRTPPGILTPEITAPGGGTTRGRPAGVGAARRNVSLMTAVCSIPFESAPTGTSNKQKKNEATCQKGKLLEFFVARRLVKDRPCGAKFGLEPLFGLGAAK